ncbi:sigma-70 family RNA polymerase sigma factor [Aquiflexum sp. LQ15W]|uniref:RNA polymerase sigma factor n=1 Tax=Cognataquiflexum nitidum TaxID=2922272 RepID=UPI001F13CF85|nr:sigma-70 family RNA polymerase sigma factor [Cognataquiflexum nitidum]MCH6199503.1 sigma-70 family RNA polymerase sigma factor [Cognataquiflexum nitidum]
MFSNDSTSFLKIIDANKGIIYKVANSYCRDEENRKDLIQEIILQLWLSFPKYDPSFKLSTWIYRIALNVSISFYRKESRRGRISQPFPEEIIYLTAEKLPLEQNEDIEMLQKFIRELKEIDRAVILLYLEGNSQQEIADILGITVSNVSTKVSRIKQTLKQKFAAINR